MNLTLKQVPDTLHKRLKEQARHNRRSLNSEVLHMLEHSVTPMNIDEIIADVRELNRVYETPAITAQEVLSAVHAGRR